MGNVRFISTKLDQITFTGSAGSDAGFPATNLNTGFHDDLWKSADSSGSQFLTLDTGTDLRDRTGIVIHNHNLNGIMATGDIRIQGAANSAFSSSVITAVQPFEPVTDPYFVAFSQPYNRRYWRVLLAGNLNAVPQIGQVFIDFAADLGSSYSLPHEPGNLQHQVSRHTALDGRLRTSSPYGGRRTYKFGFREGNALPSGVALVWQTLYGISGGGLRPTYMIEPDDTIRLGHFDFDKDTLQRLRNNLHPLEVTFSEQRVS